MLFLVQTLSVTTFLERQLQEHGDRSSQVENKVKRLTDENASMMDGVKSLMQELVMERSTGTSFLQSEAGRRHIRTLERQATKFVVDEFKESLVFQEIVMNRVMSIYDEAVKEVAARWECVSVDIIQVIDPQDSSNIDDNQSQWSFGPLL
ncbi:hypothetical protein ACS0TY_027317 [Phlomoides rotata]